MLHNNNNTVKVTTNKYTQHVPVLEFGITVWHNASNRKNVSTMGSC